MILPGLKRYHYGQIRSIDLSYNNLDLECLEKFVKTLPEPNKQKRIIGLEAMNISGNNLQNIFTIQQQIFKQSPEFTNFKYLLMEDCHGNTKEDIQYLK